jgi:type I restriction enzyme S subunit
MGTSWIRKKLGEICHKIKAGGTPSRKVLEYWNGDIPFVKIEDISSTNLYLGDTQEKISQKGLENSNAWILPPNSVLFSIYGSIGEVAINKIPVATNQAILGLIPKNEIINHKFLAYSLKAFGKYLISYNIQSTQKNLTLEIVKNFEIPLPPLPIQQKIVRILDTIQEAIDIQEKIIEKTKELKKSLMAELFKYGGPSFRKGRKLKKTEIGEIPEDWEVVRIKDIVLDIEQNDPSKTPLQEIKYIDVSSISNEFLKIVEYKSYLGKDAPSRARKILKENDIVFATVRPYLKRIAFVPKEYDGFYGSTAFCVLRSNPEKILPYFLFYYVSTDIFVSKVSGYQTGSGYPAITEDHIKNELIPLPSLSEQREIAEILQTIDQKIEIEKREKELYEELFKTMLNKIMNQEIDVEKIEV